MAVTNDLNQQPFAGLTEGEVIQKVREALEQERKGPTHPADIALKNNFMDITRNVNVPNQGLQFPKAIYRLKPAGKRTPAKIECIAVKNLEEQGKKLAEGWSLAEDFLPRPEVQALSNTDEETFDIPDEYLGRLMQSAEPVHLPIGRKPGRPRKFAPGVEA